MRSARAGNTRLSGCRLAWHAPPTRNLTVDRVKQRRFLPACRARSAPPSADAFHPPHPASEPPVPARVLPSGGTGRAADFDHRAETRTTTKNLCAAGQAEESAANRTAHCSFGSVNEAPPRNAQPDSTQGCSLECGGVGDRSRAQARRRMRGKHSPSRDLARARAPSGVLIKTDARTDGHSDGTASPEQPRVREKEAKAVPDGGNRTARCPLAAGRYEAAAELSTPVEPFTGSPCRRFRGRPIPSSP